jgi:hypothetical protein
MEQSNGKHTHKSAVSHCIYYQEETGFLIPALFVELYPYIGGIIYGSQFVNNCGFVYRVALPILIERMSA